MFEKTSLTKAKKTFWGCFYKASGLTTIFIGGLLIGCIIGIYLARYYPTLLSMWVTSQNVVASQTDTSVKIGNGMIVGLVEVSRDGERLDVFYSLFNDSQQQMSIPGRAIEYPVVDSQGRQYTPWVGVKDLIGEENLKLILLPQPEGGVFNPGYGPQCCYHVVYRIPVNRTNLQWVVGNHNISLEN